MENFQSELLMVASRILNYPTGDDKQDVQDCVENMDVNPDIKSKIKDAVDSVYRIPLKELQETYVDTFDLKSKVGLYLSAHEFGDSPKRGAALIKLQKIINQAGYSRVDEELADCIPMLYEFVAAVDDDKNKPRLIKRLACGTQRILSNLPKESAYYPIVSILMEHVFEPPTNEELNKMDQEREEADLEELPFPIMYN